MIIRTNPLSKAVNNAIFANANDGVLGLEDMEGAADDLIDEYENKVEKAKAFAAFKALAGARPDFKPVFQPLHATQRTYSKNGIPTEVTEINDGYFYDLFVIPTKEARSVSRDKLMKRFQGVKHRMTYSKASKKPIPDQSAVLYFADVFARFIETAFDQTFPESIRPFVPGNADLFNLRNERAPSGRGRGRGRRSQQQTVSDDFGGTTQTDNDTDTDTTGNTESVPLDFFNLHDDLLALNKIEIRKYADRVIIKDSGSVFKISLPSLKYPIQKVIQKIVSNQVTPEGIEEVARCVKNFAEYLRGYGINILSSSKSDAKAVDFKKILQHSKHVTHIPRLNKFLDKYVDSARIRVEPITASTTLEELIRTVRIHEREQQRQRGEQQARVKSTAAINIIDETVPTITSEDVREISDIDFTDVDIPASQMSKLLTMVSRDLSFYITVDLPKTEAQFYCQRQEQQIRAIDVLELFRTYYRNQLLPVVINLFPLEEIDALNKGFTPKPRQDSDNMLCVDKNSVFYYIPTINRIDDYSSRVTAATSRDTGEVSFDTTLDDSNSVNTGLANKLLYTDWVNNKFAYTAIDGRLQIMDMEDFYKVRPYTLLRHLNGQANSFADPDAGANYLGRFLKFYENAFNKENGLKKYALDYYTGLLSQERFRNSIEGRVLDTFIRICSNPTTGDDFAYKLLTNVVDCVLFQEEIDDDNDPRTAYNAVFGGGLENTASGNGGESMHSLRSKTISIKRALDNEFAKPILDYVTNAVKETREDINTYVSGNLLNSVPYLLQSLATWVIITQYHSKMDELKVLDEKEREVYLKNDPEKGDPNWKAELKNVTEKRRDLKNFQGRALSVLDKSPPFSILAIDAGGGKTSIAIANILQELEKGNVKRPLVLCPSHLVKDYIGECNYWCDGRVNVIPITRDVFENYTEAGILELVRSAPINTIFVSNFDVFSLGRSSRAYVNEPVSDFRYLDFFRTAGFDGVWVDESHYLKNDSGRSEAVRYAISEIPLKRLMTGTFAPNRLVDIVLQFGFFDPSVFGNQRQFIKKYQEEAVRTGKIPKEILRDLKQFCSFIYVKRREWAAELPPRVQTFIPVANMTPAQAFCYAWLCAKQQDRMAMTKSEQDDFNFVFGNSSNTKNDESSEDDSDDSDDSGKGSSDDSNEEKMDKVFGALERNLSHIEMFLAAPRYHPLANAVDKRTGQPYLPTEEDKRSPKSDVILHHITQHLKGVQTNQNGEEELKVQGGFTGKILIFTNWQRSVKQFYEDLPNVIPVVGTPKETTVMTYKASKKEAHFQKFKRVDSIKVMIGIGKSMNTGLNLQFCSRLIITETVWTPGELEQSLARVYRPVKLEFDAQGNRKPDPRQKVFINHIVVNKTIDVLKTANLISKWVMVTKTLNSDNPLYDDIPQVQEIPLTIKGLFSDDWDFTERLENHGIAFWEMLKAEHYDNEQFKAEHPEKLIPYRVTNTGLLPGSKVLSKVPYVPGQSIIKVSDLNLVPWNEWKAEWLAENEWFDIARIIRETGKKIYVHTEFGDGHVVPQNRKRKGAKVGTDDDFGDFDSDMENEEGMEDEVEVTSLETEEDIFEASQRLQEVSIDDDPSGASASDTVRCAFDLATLEFDPNMQGMLERFGSKIKTGERYVAFNIPSTRVFVILDDTLPAEGVRKAVLEASGDLPVQESDLGYKSFTAKAKNKKMKLKEKILKLSEKSAKKKHKEDVKSKKLDDLRKKADGQIEEGKRPRGRPCKDGLPPGSVPKGQKPSVVKDDSLHVKKPRINVRKVVVPTTDTDLNGAIEMFVTQNGDTLSLALSKRDPDVNVADLNSVISHSEFVSIPPYLSVHIANKKQLKTLLQLLVPTFDDGTPITTDTVVIPARIYDKLDFVPARGRSGGYYAYKNYKFPANIIENGHTVEDDSMLPELDVSEKDRQNLLSLKNLILKNLQKSGSTKITLPRAKISELKALNIMLKQKKVGAEGVLKIFGMNVNDNLHLCVPVSMNAKSSINIFRTMCASVGLTPTLQKGDIIAFYADKVSLIDDIKALLASYEITNIADVREDAAKIVTGMRGKPSAGF